LDLAASSTHPERAFRSLEGAHLERFLQRQKAGGLPEIDLGWELRHMLERARALVPSESGSILLDDPLTKVDERAENELFFVAAFGAAAERLPGKRVPSTRGIAGKVYRTGRPHLAGDARADADFSPEVDRATGHVTRSIVAAPITIGTTVIGVIELVDRVGGGPFTERDLALLEIFAGYTSSTLQNALDAKRANELARRDDLTGLSNDRWLHVRLVELIAEADAARQECALIFFDLDRFKEVNDRYGHLAGSQVLREVGFLLKRTVDVPGAILARYGGDEFVVGLPATGLSGGAEVAETLRRAIEETTFIDRHHGPELPALYLRGSITASLGVAAHRPGLSDEPAHAKERSLLHRADAAMYVAKARGKNQVASAEA
jgi:diguanylate cyclase (GGDEF)-like protein